MAVTDRRSGRCFVFSPLSMMVIFFMAGVPPSRAVDTARGCTRLVDGTSVCAAPDETDTIDKRLLAFGGSRGILPLDVSHDQWRQSTHIYAARKWLETPGILMFKPDNPWTYFSRQPGLAQRFWVFHLNSYQAVPIRYTVAEFMGLQARFEPPDDQTTPQVVTDVLRKCDSQFYTLADEARRIFGLGLIPIETSLANRSTYTPLMDVHGAGFYVQGRTHRMELWRGVQRERKEFLASNGQLVPESTVLFTCNPFIFLRKR